MSVRLRKWKNRHGKVMERWTIDVKVRLPGQPPRRIRDFSPVNTRRGAEQYERQVREALLANVYGKEVKEVPTLAAFQDRFLDYADVNNKPSTAYAKRWVLREHLVPAFGTRRLDAIGAADVEAYKARKLREGQAAKSVNNHLTVLRKLLDLAVEWGELPHAPRVEALRVAPSDFQFLTFEETERFLRAAAPEWRPFARLTHSRVKDVVPRICARAQLAKRLTTHDLRHTFASHLVMRGVALKAVQELLGHATIDMRCATRTSRRT